MVSDKRSSEIRETLRTVQHDVPDGLWIVPRRITDDFLSIALHVIGDFDRKGEAGRWFTDRVRALVEAGATSIVFSCERFVDANGHYSIDPLLTPVLQARDHVVVLAAVPQLLHQVISGMGIATLVPFASNIDEGAKTRTAHQMLGGLPRGVLCPVCESPIELKSLGFCACPWCSVQFAIEGHGLLTMRYRPHPNSLPEIVSSASSLPLLYRILANTAVSMRTAHSVDDDGKRNQDEEVEQLDGAE